MDHSFFVGVVHGEADIAHHGDFVQKTQVGPGFFQRVAIDKLHGNVGFACDFADFVDVTDVGMVQTRLRARFLHEAMGHLLVAAANELERHQPSEPLVFGFVDRAHAALTEQLVELVAIPGLDGELVSCGRTFVANQGTIDGALGAELIADAGFGIDRRGG